MFFAICAERILRHMKIKIDKRLVDFFYHYPDDCKMINDPYKDKSTKHKAQKNTTSKAYQVCFRNYGQYGRY